MKPLATNLALYLSRVPSALVLILKIHFELIGFRLEGSEVNVQVLFFSKEVSSAVMAACHSLESDLDNASCKVYGGSDNTLTKFA